MRKCPHCGSSHDPNDKPRSVPQLRRYFAMLRAAYHHWPESAEVQFSSEEDFRAFVQMKAGWREIGARIPLVGVNKERVKLVVEAAIRGAGAHAHPIIHKDELVIFRPQSISFSSMGPQEFGELCDKVSDVIKAMTGLDPEQMMKETETAA